MLRHKPVTPSAILEKERESVIYGHVMDFGLDSTSCLHIIYFQKWERLTIKNKDDKDPLDDSGYCIVMDFRKKNKRDESVSQLGSNSQPLGSETSTLLAGLTGPPRCENHPIGSITIWSYIKLPNH